MMKQNQKFWQRLLPVFFLCALIQVPTSPASSAATYQANAGDYMSDIAGDGFYTWPKDKLPVKVYFQPGDGIPGFKSYYPDVLRSCFDEWTQAMQGRVSWKEVKDSRAADIRVSWSDQVVEESAGTEAGKTRTYARYNPSTNWGIIDRADMRLLTRLPEREFSDSEVRKAYLHEVGHAFGIAGHSKDRNCIMYHAVVASQNTSLHANDIATLANIYDQSPEHQQLITRQPETSRSRGVRTYQGDTYMYVPQKIRRLRWGS